MEGVVATGASGAPGAPSPPRTRLWREGRLSAEGFAVGEVGRHLADPAAVVWVDLADPQQLRQVCPGLGLDPVSVSDALSHAGRTKLDRYPSYLFLNAYLVDLDRATGRLAHHAVSAFVTPRALVTVNAGVLDLAGLTDRWDTADRVSHGVAGLLHGLLDLVVHSQLAAVRELDEALEELEDLLFDEAPHDIEVQRRSYRLRKSLVMLRSAVLPMRDVTEELPQQPVVPVPPPLSAAYRDVHDHAIRAGEWTDKLRDLVTTILETALSLQNTRLNVTMRRLTGWAAVIAVPSAITGFYGMNVPFPGSDELSGLLSSTVLLVGSALGLYLLLRRRGWL